MSTQNFLLEKITRDMKAAGICDYTLSPYVLNIGENNYEIKNAIKAGNEFYYLSDINYEDITGVTASYATAQFRLDVTDEAANTVFKLKYKTTPFAPPSITLVPADSESDNRGYVQAFLDEYFPNWTCSRADLIGRQWQIEIDTEPTAIYNENTLTITPITTGVSVNLEYPGTFTGGVTGVTAATGGPAINIEAENRFLFHDFSVKPQNLHKISWQLGFTGQMAVTVSRPYVSLEFIRVTPAHRQPCNKTCTCTTDTCTCK